MANDEFHHGAPTELGHPGKPAGSGGSKSRWGTDTPLGEDVLRKLHPTFNTSKAVLEWSWRFIGFFGLPLVIIGAYYTWRLVKRISGGDDDYCNPGEEFNAPITDTLGMIWAILVIAMFLMYVSIIAALVVFIVFLGSCLNVTDKLVGLITNPLGAIAEFQACGNILLQLPGT